MSLNQIFAHSDDLHTAATSELEHLLTSNAVAIPLYVLLNILIFGLLSKYRKSLVLPALLGINLLIGVLVFNLVPAVSVIAITIGITSALFISLTLLAKN